MNDVYGDDAPLFCEDERLFKLSPEAEVVRHHAPERAVRHVSPRKKRSVAEPAAV